MGNFMPTGGVTKQAPIGNTLVSVIQPLNPKSKCAMFAAARAGTIARRTWNGCAWNAAGVEDGAGDISSVTAAANNFGVDQVHVSRFIGIWDAIPPHVSDEVATQMLIEALEYVGIFTEPNVSRTTRIIKGYAYKSQATKFAEQLDSGELTVAMIPGAQEMEQLLSAI